MQGVPGGSEVQVFNNNALRGGRELHPRWNCLLAGLGIWGHSHLNQVLKNFGAGLGMSGGCVGRDGQLSKALLQLTFHSLLRTQSGGLISRHHHCWCKTLS